MRSENAAVGVGYLTSKNPSAAPAHLAIEVRVLIIGGYIAAGIYAQTSHIQARMGTLLIGTGLFASLWLLNGSTNRVAFTIAVACTSVMPMIVAGLMLSHIEPRGGTAGPAAAGPLACRFAGRRAVVL